MNRYVTVSVSDGVPDADSINQWFDYWAHKMSENQSSRSAEKAAFVESIRECALIGREHKRISDAEVNRKTIERLRRLTEELERTLEH